MTVRGYHVLRLTIYSAERYAADVFDPDRNQQSSQVFDLGYRGARRDRIRELQAAARQKAALKGELSSGEVRELGVLLYETVFDPAVESRALAVLDQARRTPGGLFRIEILVDDQALPEIAALPWEFLRCPQRGAFWLGTQ